jgi:predicted nucleic acid-binding protein
LATAEGAPVFIDSSVLFAATYSERGSARDLLLAGLRGELVLALSGIVLEETHRNIARKAPDKLPAFARLRPLLEPLVTDPPDELVRRVAARIEPKDAPIIAAALAAGARYVATYDRRHLLDQAAAIRAAFDLLVTTPDRLIARS